MPFLCLLPIHRCPVQPAGIMGDRLILFVLPPVQGSNLIATVEKGYPGIGNDDAVQEQDPLDRQFKLVAVLFVKGFLQAAQRSHCSAVSGVQGLRVEFVKLTFCKTAGKFAFHKLNDKLLMRLWIHTQISDYILLKSPADVIVAPCVIDPYAILGRAVINRHGALHQAHIPGCEGIPQQYHKRRIVHDMALFLLGSTEIFNDLMGFHNGLSQEDNGRAHILYDHLIHFQKGVHLRQVHG